MKTQHEIIINAPRERVFDAFASRGEDAVIGEITETRKPDFVAGTTDTPGCRAVIVGHFRNESAEATRVVVYANRFFFGLRKLTSLVSAGAMRRDIEDKLDRLKLAIESDGAAR